MPTPTAPPTAPANAQARTLVDQYTQRLEALARAQLAPQLRPKLDPSDVVQSVFRTLFRRAAQGDLTLDNQDTLWGLLARITVRKCHQHAEHFRAGRRDVRRERSPDGGPHESHPEAASPAPAPEEVAVLHETVAWLSERLRSPRKRQILELSLEGYGVVEISAKLGYYERGVERVRAEIKDLLLQLR